MSRGIVAILALIIVPTVGFILLEAFSGGGLLHFDNRGETAVRSDLVWILSAGTILGIIARSAFPTLLGAATESAVATIKNAFAIPKILAAVVVSPLVIAYFYATVRDLHDSFLVFILSFQNGFFWDTVIAAVRAKMTSSRANHDESGI